MRWFFREAAKGTTTNDLVKKANRKKLAARNGSSRTVLRLLTNHTHAGHRPDGAPGRHDLPGRRALRRRGRERLDPRTPHDWDDDDAVALLRRVRGALRHNARILILDAALDADRPRGGLCDLHVLAVTGGRDRTLNEVESLLGRVGPGLATAPLRSAVVRILEAFEGQIGGETLQRR